MRIPIRVVAVAALLMANLVGVDTVRAAIVTSYSAIGSQPIVDGVVHEWGTSQAEYDEPLDELPPETTTQEIDVLRVDPAAPDIHFETALPHSRINAVEKTTLQAARESRPGHRVVAATNGDFWRTEEGQRSPVNINVRNGELVSANSGERGALGFMADGTPIIGRPVIDMSITLPDTTVRPLKGVNQVRDLEDLILYTPTYGPTVGSYSPGVDVVLSGVALPLPVSGSFTGTVVSIQSDVTQSSIPPDSVVLSAAGAEAAHLSALVPNDTVQLDISISEPWQNVVNAVGGIRILVHDGIPATDFSTPPEIYRNARLAAGITADGKLILTTVGGSESRTAGLTQADLAQLMASLGAVEAINLDGGGSTTMAVDPVGEAPLGLVNTPADGFQRSVNTTLLVISTAAEPGPVVPAVTPPILRLSPGMSAGKDDAAVDISWQASDGDGEIVATELERRLSTGTWQAVTLPAANATSVNRRLKFKKDYQYRVRVTDDAGYQSEWAIGRIYRINAVNERATAITRTGKWPVVSATSAIGGNFGRSNAKKGTGQSATLSYSAVQVAWIAPSGAKGGTATVSLDGTPSGSVSLASPSSRARVVQFVGPALDETTLAIAPSRTIRLTNVSTLIRPYVDLDAFLLLTVR